MHESIGHSSHSSPVPQAPPTSSSRLGCSMPSETPTMLLRRQTSLACSFCTRAQWRHALRDTGTIRTRRRARPSKRLLHFDRLANEEPGTRLPLLKKRWCVSKCGAFNDATQDSSNETASFEERFLGGLATGHVTGLQLAWKLNWCLTKSANSCLQYFGWCQTCGTCEELSDC